MANQDQMLDQITEKQQSISQDWLTYWNNFSSFNTWQFWFLVFMFIAPLVVLYFTLDRKRAFQIGFFGFNIHVWFGYCDAFGTKQGLWNYPYQLFPFTPNSLVLDASLIPVLFMLVYQWTVNTKRNYYLYTSLLVLFLSFIFKPLLVSFNLFTLYQGVNHFHLFLSYVVIMILSKLITDIFLHFQKGK
ncbi:hypothetical protein FZC66_08135 [Priestia megaterium]|nr:hypothetical protein FZC66_08135 [Priestia megaterium]